MNWQYWLYAIVMLSAAGLSAVVAVVAWDRRGAAGAGVLALLMLAVAEWTFAGALETVAAQAAGKIFWAKIAYLGIVSIPVLWLLFTLAYTNQDGRLSLPWKGLLWLVPCVTLSLVFSNESHGLIWTDITPSPAGPYLIYRHGTWYWIAVVYGYLLILIGMGTLVHGLVRSPLIHRRQAIAILAGALIPWAGNILYQARQGTAAGLDVTPLAFALTGIIGAWSVFRFQLLDLLPVARSALIESMSDGVLVLDGANRVIDINPAARRLLSSPDGPAGRQPAAGVAERAWHNLLEPYRDVRELQTELRMNDPLRHLDLRISSLYDHRRHFKGRLVVIRDITERKLAEAELLEAKQAAETASRSKSMFLSSMSHELRTPLNAIQGFAELLVGEANLTPGQRASIDIIARSSEHLLALINDVLDMARIEAGRVDLNVHDFDLHRLLNSLHEMFNLRASDKSLDLVFERGADVPRYITADERKLRQVLINLLGNAIKFTDSGTVRLGVSAHLGEAAQAQPARQLAFEVRDSGVGMTQEEMVTIFDPFVQAASGRQYREGTGLGLSISRQFVTLMGGHLAVESWPGKGSTFAFSIPVRLVPDRALAPALPARTIVGVEPGEPSPRLLVAEDQEPSRQALVALLTRLGFDVREAAAPQAALELWEEWEPDLVWLDLRVTAGHGWQRSRTHRTVVVALVASDLAEDRAMALADGCDDVLIMPYHVSDVLNVLSRHLKVRFRFSRPSPAGSVERPVIPAVSGDDLSLHEVPTAWLADLEQAVVQSDPDEILSAIGKIGTQNQALAAALAVLANDFEYRRILELIHREQYNE